MCRTHVGSQPTFTQFGTVTFSEILDFSLPTSYWIGCTRASGCSRRLTAKPPLVGLRCDRNKSQCTHISMLCCRDNGSKYHILMALLDDCPMPVSAPATAVDGILHLRPKCHRKKLRDDTSLLDKIAAQSQENSPFSLSREPPPGWSAGCVLELASRLNIF